MSAAAKKTKDEVLQVPITAEQLEFLLHLQQKIMKKIAVGEDHQKVLDDLCKAAEAMLPNAVASIMLFDDKRQHLQVKAAPNIPQDGIDALNGLIPGEEAGSCGTAVYQNDPQFVIDTSLDQRWSHDAFQEFAQNFGVDACWSMPIRSANNDAIGSFALSSMEKRQPHLFHKKLLETCAHITGIVLQKEQQEEQLWYLAHHDTLTNLPNRLMFDIRLEHAIEIAERSGNKIAILFIDLDNFKNINDTLGHDSGDRALQEASHRIQACIRKDDTLSRMGGDEFTLMLENITDPLQASMIADKISGALSSPVVLNQHQYQLTASIGISLFPDDGRTPRDLLQNADTAMYEAKNQGRHCSVFYEPELTNMVKRRLKLESELKQALKHDEFVLHYQPQFDLENNLVATEVLVRWQHPEKGLVPPVDFIGIAEETGMIDELGNLIANKAMQQCKDWWSQGLVQFKLAVNLSVKQLKPGYAEQLSGIVNQVGFPLDHLEMEVTESLILEKGSQAIDELTIISEMGISIAMDDFGTGHSSLSQLKNLPISKLKIDRSFVSELTGNDDDSVIVKTIIAMGKSLNLKVVAEGVETDRQRVFLNQQGCDYLQGYLLGRPMDKAGFESLLKQLTSG